MGQLSRRSNIFPFTKVHLPVRQNIPATNKWPARRARANKNQ